MFKPFYYVEVRNDFSNDLIFEAYREDYDAAKKLMTDIIADMETKGFQESYSATHNYCGDFSKTAVLDNGSKELTVRLCNEGWMTDWPSGIHLYIKGGLPFVFKTEKEAFDCLEKLEKNGSWNW